MISIRSIAQTGIYIWCILASQAAVAQTCVKSLTSENLVTLILQSEAFGKDSTVNNMLMASWIFRSGYPTQAERFLEALATGEGALISVQPPEWSHAIGIIRAAQSDAQFDISDLLGTISDPELSKTIAKDMIPAALIAAGRVDDLLRHYPVGETQYTQNLWGGTGIRLLARAGYDAAAVKLYRKHDLGYHSAGLLDTLASELLAGQDTAFLEKVLAEETARVSEFSKDGTFTICMAGGVRGVPGDAKTCRAKSDLSLSRRVLELFDQNAYTNGYLAGARQSPEQVNTCLGGIRKRLDASGADYADEDLAGDVYSIALFSKIAKFNGLIALPNPPDLPTSVFTDMEIEDVDTISAHVAGLMANGEAAAAAVVLERAMAAYNANLDAKKTGASALLGFRSPQIPIYLNTLPFSYLAQIFERFDTVEGLLYGLEVMQEITADAKDQPQLAEGFANVEQEFIRALLRVYAQDGDGISLLGTISQNQVAQWPDYPLLLTELAVKAHDMYAHDTALDLTEWARTVACEAPNFPREQTGFLQGRDERIFLKRMFLMTAVSEGKLSPAVLGHVR